MRLETGHPVSECSIYVVTERFACLGRQSWGFSIVESCGFELSDFLSQLLSNHFCCRHGSAECLCSSRKASEKDTDKVGGNDNFVIAATNIVR